MAETKPRTRCIGCNRKLPPSHFPRRAGSIVRSVWCHDCSDLAAQKRRDDRRVEHQQYLREQAARDAEEIPERTRRAWDRLSANTREALG